MPLYPLRTDYAAVVLEMLDAIGVTEPTAQEIDKMRKIVAEASIEQKYSFLQGLTEQQYVDLFWIAKYRFLREFRAKLAKEAAAHGELCTSD